MIHQYVLGSFIQPVRNNLAKRKTVSTQKNVLATNDSKGRSSTKKSGTNRGRLCNLCAKLHTTQLNKSEVGRVESTEDVDKK